ncbi:MAG TPA: hypothetical protein VHD36_15515 [Pirellulales bacterium]|nr:hypothetical protein [Pirellulales bacterium]
MNRLSRTFCVCFSHLLASIALAQEPIAIVAADSTPAAPANDEATQTRVRELVYVLRNHRVFERTDQWASAIRELATIGRPALPELLLELKSTRRNATLRGLFFTLRVMNDPRSIDAVVAAIPKVLEIKGGSDCGLNVLDPELRQFMKQHEDFPSSDNSVSYGRPINEILATLHKLYGEPLPDFKENRNPPTWSVDYWQERWKKENASRKETEEDQIRLPMRNEDLVERDGVRRFGPLFPTGVDQHLGPVVDVVLNSQYADKPACLDLDTGRAYEYLEGLHHNAGDAEKQLSHVKWATSHGVDVIQHVLRDVHLWMIANERWDSLDSEVRSGKPLDRGNEASDLFLPNGETQATFLFTTREGAQGALRLVLADGIKGNRTLQYRLWNRGKMARFNRDEEPVRDSGEWQLLKRVTLAGPGFEKECLYDFESASAKTLPKSIFAADTLPDLDELLKNWGLFHNDRIASWAKEQGIDLAASRTNVAGQGPLQLHNVHDGQTIQLLMLSARLVRVSDDAIGKLTLRHGRDILDRYPSQFRLAYLTPSLQCADPSATYLFETESGLIGLLRIVKIGERLSSITFDYELANVPRE